MQIYSPAAHDPRYDGVEVWENFCQCEKCEGYRQRYNDINSHLDVMEKLGQMDITPHALVSMIAFLMPDEFHKRVDQMAREAAERYTREFLDQPGTRDKLASMLFEDIYDIALGVYEGYKTNAKPKGSSQGKSRTR